MALAIGIGVAAVFVFVLTFVRATAEVHQEAKGAARYSVCAKASLPYFLLLLAYIAGATLIVPLLAPAWAAQAFFDPLPVYVRPFIYALLGFIAFQAIVARLTLTVAGRGSGRNLSGGESLATTMRNSSVEAASSREIDLVEEQKPQTERHIRALPENELDALVVHHLGQAELTNLNNQATQTGASAPMLKSHELVAHKDAEMRAIVKDLKKQNRR